MKKFLILLLTVLICITLSGCNNNEDIHVDSRSGMNNDSLNILIPNEYTVKNYQKEYTENGLIVTINYELFKVEE